MWNYLNYKILVGWLFKEGPLSQVPSKINFIAGDCDCNLKIAVYFKYDYYSLENYICFRSRRRDFAIHVKNIKQYKTCIDLQFHIEIMKTSSSEFDSDGFICRYYVISNIGYHSNNIQNFKYKIALIFFIFRQVQGRWRDSRAKRRLLQNNVTYKRCIFDRFQSLLSSRRKRQRDR